MDCCGLLLPTFGPLFYLAENLLVVESGEEISIKSLGPLKAAMYKTECLGNPNYVVPVGLIFLGHMEFFCLVKEESNAVSITGYVRGPVHSKVLPQGMKYNSID